MAALGSLLIARRLSVWNNKVSTNRCCSILLRVPFVAALRNQRQTLMVVPTTAVSSVRAGRSSCRQFAVWTSQKPQVDNDDEEQQPDYKHRHMGIQMHPDSISNLILPGNVVSRKSRQGDIKQRYTELVYGYFWMLKDLKLSQEKPVLSNRTLIEEKKSKIFPNIKRLKSLSGNNVVVDFPSYLLRKNRSRDPYAQCTLVAISFRDFGYQQLPSWIEPFEEKDAFINDNERVEIVKLNISEGWFNKWILRGFILGITKRNTPDKTEQERTFMYFNSSGSTEMENLRDSLRMHNVMVGYVFLLDGLGRVRFAGSGMATKEEARRLVQLAKQLTPLASASASASKRKRRKGGNVNKTAVP